MGCRPGRTSACHSLVPCLIRWWVDGLGALFPAVWVVAVLVVWSHAIGTIVVLVGKLLGQGVGGSIGPWDFHHSW